MNINERIEHTLLSTEAQLSEIQELGDEAKQYGFRGICVPPYFVKHAVRHRGDSRYKIITVVDFPFGYGHAFSKAEAINKAKDQGADAVDVVMNYTAALNGDWGYVEDDLNTVVHKAHMAALEIKIIIELGAYSSKTLKRIVELCKKVRPNFVKTNTGTMGHRVEREQLRLLHRLLGGELPIKASGGIRSKEDAQAVIDLGAEVIGTSSATKW